MNAPIEPGLAAALAALGLRPDADARSVRRAYAVQLKQIDQATQLQAFQDLREAYEFALAVMAQRDMQVQRPPEPRPEAQPEPSPAPQADEPVSLAEEPTPTPAEPTMPTGAQLSQAVFQGFAARAGAGFRDEADAMAALQAVLADDRLLNLEARTLFELQVAHLIMGGWQPGHEFLFDPACDVFSWERDRAHLRIFGQLGAALDVAINEKLIFFRRGSEHFELALRAMKRLREAEMPSVALRRADLPLVQMLVQRYPNWLRLVTSQDRINTWFSNLPEEAPAPQEARPDFRPKWKPVEISSWSSTAPKPAQPEPTLQQGWKTAKALPMWLFAILLLCIAFNAFLPSTQRTRQPDGDPSRSRAAAPTSQPLSTRPPDTVLGAPPNTEFGASAPMTPPLYEGQPKSLYDPPSRPEAAGVQIFYLGNVTFNRRGGQVIVDDVEERSRRGTSTLRPGDRLQDCTDLDSRVPLIFLIESSRCGATKTVDSQTGVVTYTFRVLRKGQSLTASLAMPPAPGASQQASPNGQPVSSRPAPAALQPPPPAQRPPIEETAQIGHVTFLGSSGGLVLVSKLGKPAPLSSSTLQPWDRLLRCLSGDYAYTSIKLPSEAQRCIVTDEGNAEPGVKTYKFRVARDSQVVIASLTLRDALPAPASSAPQTPPGSTH